MRLPSRLILFAAAITVAASLAACTANSKSVDVAVAVPDGYAAREAAKFEQEDRCGPEFIQNALPKAFVNIIGAITDGAFRPVCRRHDACYRLKEKTQSWCDDRMRDEMMAICDTGKATPAYSVPVIGKPLCKFQAGLYYAAINSTFGGYAYGGLPGGEIVAVRVRRIDDRFTDDELEICVDVKNPTKIMQEYDIEMHTEDGRLVDREPDLHEENVRAGETEEFCVSTNLDPRWSISDLGDRVYISIRADTPASFAFTNDMVIVDTKTVDVPR